MTVFQKNSRTCSAKLEKSGFQISLVYKLSHLCKGDWKNSQSWCWIGTPDTCKLFFYGLGNICKLFFL